MSTLSITLSQHSTDDLQGKLTGTQSLHFDTMSTPDSNSSGDDSSDVIATQNVTFFPPVTASTSQQSEVTYNPTQKIVLDKQQGPFLKKERNSDEFQSYLNDPQNEVAEFPSLYPPQPLLIDSFKNKEEQQQQHNHETDISSTAFTPNCNEHQRQNSISGSLSQSSSLEIPTLTPSPNMFDLSRLDDIQDCEVKAYLLAVAKKIGRKDEEILPVIRNMVKENWLETISHLEALTDADWSHLPYPRQFVRLVRHNLPNAYKLIGSFKPVINSSEKDRRNSRNEDSSSHISSSYSKQKDDDQHEIVLTHKDNDNNTMDGHVKDKHQEVKRFIHRICVKHQFSPSDRDHAVQCLIEDNWLDTLDSLKDIPLRQLKLLSLPDGFAEVLSQELAEATLLDNNNITVLSVLYSACVALGRQHNISKLNDIVQTLHEHGFTTAESLQHVSDEEWGLMKLPLRLIEELRKELITIYGEKEGAVLLEEKEQSDRDLTGSNTICFTDNIIPQSTCHIYTSESSLITPIQLSAGQTTTGDDNNCSLEDDPRVVTTKEAREARMMTVEKLLRNVGTSVGKSQQEMDPIINRVIRENWFDTLKSLRTLSVTDWQDLGLPKRFVESTRKALSDPYVLELNTVQFVAPESELFPCDVYTAVWSMETEIPPEKLTDTLRSLLRLMETILCNPFDESKRIIRKSNPNFQTKAGCYKSALRVLEAVGYEEAEDKYLLPVAYISRITEAHAALAQLAHVYRDRFTKMKKSTKRGFFSSVKRK